MSLQMWKSLVVVTMKKQTFSQLSHECITNAKTRPVAYDRLQKSSYINLLGPQVVLVHLRAKLGMFDLKTNFKKYTSHSCPFCRAEPETFHYLFKCTDGLHCPQSLKDVTLQNHCKIQMILIT